jgi:hypothetical protein
MTRPKALLDRIAIERVATEGVSPEGPAVPDAVASDKPMSTGATARITALDRIPGTPSTVAQKDQQLGATANPRTGIPEMRATASIKVRDDLPGQLAMPLLPNQDKAQSTPGMRVGQTKVMAPETFAGQMAVPRITDAIAGLPPSIKNRQTVTGTAAPTTSTRVTVTVPPAFPIDPKEAFAAFDAEVQLPPRTDTRRTIQAPRAAEQESTETFVANSYMAGDGASSVTDRWVL